MTEPMHLSTEPGRSESHWYDTLDTINLMRAMSMCEDEEVLELGGEIICQTLMIEKDCQRALGPEQKHQLYFFTNYRVSQVYCIHNIREELTVDQLRLADRLFRLGRREKYTDPDKFISRNRLQSLTPDASKTYDFHTSKEFGISRAYLAWEYIFPEGIDMEALSPRDVNANIKLKETTQKAKAPPAKPSVREKDHPPPPPAEVHEPPSSDRRNGAIYQVGRLLGKGGFAICHEGELAGTGGKVALKIVKSHMPQKKMEQKFQTELQIHSKMRHPNIVQFHRAFTYQQSTYIVLELCPNGSLMDMVKKRKFITEPEVRFYTVQMAGAIKYIHGRGIIHRDLKMGNIFLDKEMNVKIGDFGLAALLMSGKDMTACRRTTLCGTPNYIAPEILEKGKKGHDHAVDIWSLGIIIFAMLTGRPPFQSNTQEEIYRKAREREYDWPKLETSENSICQEAKDLVAVLLQSPENRPDPDTIVRHPFFSCGWVPQAGEMSPKLRESAPDPNQFLSVGLRNGRSNLYTRNLKKLCITSDVGPYSQPRKVHSSTYREVAAEEKAGLTPLVPLPDNVVYRPFDEWLKEQSQSSIISIGSVSTNTNREQERPDVQPLSVRPLATATRVAQQSFAAQQRAQNHPVPSTLTSRRERAPHPDVSDPGSRHRKAPSEEVQNNGRGTTKLLPKSARPQSEAQLDQVREAAVSVEARIGADLVQQLNQAEADRNSHKEVHQEVSEVPLSIFSPSENPELLPNTKPELVLRNLHAFCAEIERALKSEIMAPDRKPPTSNPTLVVKWVDYTNKFGLGYILSNGSIGCIFRECIAVSGSSTGRIPPTCVVILGAEKHLQNRGNPSYTDRHQLVPISGPNIEFYENKGEEGISRITVNPRDLTVRPGQNGDPGRLTRGRDEYDDRRREKIVLWNKFAKYMTTYGRDQDYPFDEALQRTSYDPRSEKASTANVVTFYQRFGDVGCWGFGDGHFQFNFPDHTKVIISADGTWCDFYHLPLEAARDLSMTGSLPASALDDRQHLSYPLQTLLNFLSKPPTSLSAKGSSSRKRPQINPMIQGIPRANDFRRKVEFIRDITREWIKNCGLGNSQMEPEQRLRWLGYREKENVKIPYKHVWATVGARGGDERRVAWFDPRKPEQIVPDMEC